MGVLPPRQSARPPDSSYTPECFQYADIMKEMRTELDAWMAQQNDRGMETELEAYAHVNPASAKNKLYREAQDK